MARSMRANKERMGATGVGVADVDKLGRDASEVGIGVITVLAALIGLWGIACLVGAIANEGLLNIALGWISAVTGH